jgi:hypothetical protein
MFYHQYFYYHSVATAYPYNFVANYAKPTQTCFVPVCNISGCERLINASNTKMIVMFFLFEIFAGFIYRVNYTDNVQ